MEKINIQSKQIAFTYRKFLKILTLEKNVQVQSFFSSFFFVVLDDFKMTFKEEIEKRHFKQERCRKYSKKNSNKGRC